MRTINARTVAGFESEDDAHPVPYFESEAAHGAEGGAIGQIVSRALSLRPRRGVGNDGPVVRSLSARLRVQLLARRIHPWDRRRPANERNEMFVQQCLEDVSIAIPKLFRSMPEIDEMEITVLDPRDNGAIIAGAVTRSDALASNSLPAGMKLNAMGLAYGRTNSGFERMKENPVYISQ